MNEFETIPWDDVNNRRIEIAKQMVKAALIGDKASILAAFLDEEYINDHMIIRPNQIDIPAIDRIIQLDNGYQYCPLTAAASVNNLHLLKLFLEHGAQVCSAIANNAESPLHLAVKNDNLKMVQLLLEFGANPNQQCGYLHTPISLAREHGRDDILLALQNRTPVKIG